MEEGTGFEAKMGDGSEPDKGFFRVCRFQDWPTVSWLMHPRPEGRGRESDPCSADSVICSTGIDASATSGSSNPDGEIDRERGTLSGGSRIRASAIYGIVAKWWPLGDDLDFHRNRTGGLLCKKHLSTPDQKLQSAYRIIAVLFATAIGLGLLLFWNLRPGDTVDGSKSLIFQLSPLDENPIQAKYPQVDFGRFYPGVAPDVIDQIQRECFATRFIYEPFVQFKPMPIRHQHVEVSVHGFRKGADVQPWPPGEEDFVVFVFGGSTTFGYGLANDQTLVVELQKAFNQAAQGPRFQCYNFGRGFYDSAQERALFESLLHAGRGPDAAIFIDGLNDFYFPQAEPILTPELTAFTAPDLPEPMAAPAASPGDVIRRMAANHRMIRGIAKEFEIKVLFVAQPVPFFKYSADPIDYPFTPNPEEFRTITLGYQEWERSARDAAELLWLADLFVETKAPAYLDQVHYTKAAGRRLAQEIVAAAGFK